MERESFIGPEIPGRIPIREILDVYDLRASYLLTEEEASRLVDILHRFGPFTIVGRRLELSDGGELDFFQTTREIEKGKR